jgi:chromosome segregation ATPase
MNEISIFRNVGPANDAYELEELLHSAEGRYASARAQHVRARAEFEILASSRGCRTSALDVARKQLETANARCDRVRREIAKLEALLD